jgi:hypothetical protein
MGAPVSVPPGPPPPTPLGAALPTPCTGPGPADTVADSTAPPGPGPDSAPLPGSVTAGPPAAAAAALTRLSADAAGSVTLAWRTDGAFHCGAGHREETLSGWALGGQDELSVLRVGGLGRAAKRRRGVCVARGPERRVWRRGRTGRRMLLPGGGARAPASIGDSRGSEEPGSGAKARLPKGPAARPPGRLPTGGSAPAAAPPPRLSEGAPACVRRASCAPARDRVRDRPDSPGPGSASATGCGAGDEGSELALGARMRHCQCIFWGNTVPKSINHIVSRPTRVIKMSD